MKGETQAVHLANIMQKHKLYPEYELVLPLAKVKSKKFKKLSQGDLLLLGLEHLELKLLSEGRVCANVVLSEAKNSYKIKIVNLGEDPILMSDSKKYEILKCSFGMLQSRKLEVGHKIDITSLNLQEVMLYVENEYRADGQLVNVDNEIAIEIVKVNKNAK